MRKGKWKTNQVSVNLGIIGQMLDAEDNVTAKANVMSCQSHGRQRSRLARYDENQNTTGVHSCRFNRDETSTPRARLWVKVRQAALPVKIKDWTLKIRIKYPI